MFVKLQHLDTNCIPIFNPVKTNNINAGVSLPLPRHRIEREIEQHPIKKHKFPPQKPSEFDKTNVFNKPKSNPNGSGENPDREKGTIEKYRGVKERPWLRKETIEKEKLHTKCSTKVVSGNEVVKKVHTKCSMKWARYGGCIPAILEALERVGDLDEAFKPWELSLSNKESVETK